MRTKLETEDDDLRELTNRQIVERVVRTDTPTPLEVELALRLEAFIELHGDYLEGLD